MEIGLPDIGVTLLFQSLGNWLVVPMVIISFLGTEMFFMLLLPAIYWCIDSSLGIRIGMMLLLSNIVNLTLKLIFHSPRPFWVSQQVEPYSSETSFGMPSGHSQVSASIWGYLAVFYRKKWSIILAGLVVFLVGISRIYLGVHYSLDVLAGWFTGVILLLAFVLLEKPISTWFNLQPFSVKQVLVFITSMLITFLPVLTRQLNSGWQIPESWVTNSQNAVPGLIIDPLNIEGGFTVGGTWFGMLAGFVLLNHTSGKVFAGGTIQKRLLRYIIGIIGILIIWAGLKVVFPSGDNFVAYMFRYFRYVLAGFWVSAAAPYLFYKLKLIEIVKERNQP